jgi:uncharacterized protein (TIGR01244 family)
MFRLLDDRMAVSPQITPADVASAAAQGFTLIINNRPDGEQPGQPKGAEIAAAAAAAGLEYVAIPVVPGQLGEAEIVAMRDALAHAAGPVLGYCRTGTRSTFLWALARARLGDTPEALAAKAQAAGYDITPIRKLL